VAGPEIFLGKWRIVEMEKWDRTYLDLLGRRTLPLVPWRMATMLSREHSPSHGEMAVGLSVSLRMERQLPNISWEGRSDRDDAFAEAGDPRER
jgi:hypothetical protein